MPVSWLDRLTTLGQSFLTGMQHLVYPGCCLLCGRLLAMEEVHFCAVCRRDLFLDASSVCPHCGGTIGPYAAIDERCPACRKEEFAFERVVRLGRYDGLLREVILRLKHQNGEGLAELLGEYWARLASARFAELHVDALTPIPLHWLRRWQRGYNQSAALCRGLATVLRIPYQPGWLRRVRHTPFQYRLTPSARRANMRGVFQARPGAPLKGQSILLVDDVMTTGATASEAARALRAAGASRVFVAVMARAQG